MGTRMEAVSYTHLFLSFQVDPKKFEAATDAEKAQQVTQRESVSFLRDAMRRLRRNKMAMVCLWLLVAITLIAVIVPYFYPYTYTQQDVTAKHLGPFESVSYTHLIPRCSGWAPRPWPS